MMEIIIGSTSVIIFGIFIMSYLIRKHKKGALEEVFQEYFLLTENFKTYPKGLRFELRNEYKELVKQIKEIENKYKNIDSEKNIYEFIEQMNDSLLEFKAHIKMMREKWRVYEKFINDVNYIKLSIENFLKNLEDKKAEALFYDEDEEKKEQLEEVFNNHKKELDALYNEYDIQGIATFNEFDYYQLQELEEKYTELETRVKKLETSYENYHKEIQVFIIGVSRKTVFYINLKELLEGTNHGRNKSRNLGEITVSAKTYEKLEIASNYKQAIYVTGKRTNTDLSVDVKLLINGEEKANEYEITYEELVELLKNVKLPGDGDLDEHGIPYNFECACEEFQVGTKEKKELDVNFSIKNEFFERIKF